MEIKYNKVVAKSRTDFHVFYACALGDEDTVNNAIMFGWTKTNWLDYALVVAASRGDLSSVDTILKDGADVTAFNDLAAIKAKENAMDILSRFSPQAE